MVHKLCKAVEERDDTYTIEGMIKMDEVYFTAENSQKKHRVQKSDRGNKTNPNVIIIAKSEVLEDIEPEK